MSENTTNTRTKRQIKPKYKSIDEVPIPVPTIKPAVQDPVQDEDQIEETPTNTVIEISELADLLKTDSSQAAYEIYFPSKKKSYQFKQMTVGQQRLISKQSADFENRVEQLKSRISLLNALCLDPTFDALEINWAEFCNAIIAIKANNSIEPLSYQLSCDNKDCDAKFPLTVNFDEISSKLDALVRTEVDKEVFFEFEMAGKKIRFYLKFPDMKRYLKLAELFMKNKKYSEDSAAFDYPYINKITIDGKEVNIESKKMNLIEFINFIDNTFTGLDFRKFEKKINDSFSAFVEAMTEYEVSCPVCRTVKKVSITIDDFFDL